MEATLFENKAYNGSNTENTKGNIKTQNYNIYIILHKAIYPSLWRITVVCVFLNKGTSLLAKCYHLISLVQLLSKLFTSV